MRTSILLTLVFIVFALASAPAYGQRAEASIEIAADEVPDTYRLTAPHPNPFNPQTQFTLSVNEAQHVTVEVYNLLGRRVVTPFCAVSLPWLSTKPHIRFTIKTAMVGHCVTRRALAYPYNVLKGRIRFPAP